MAANPFTVPSDAPTATARAITSAPGRALSAVGQFISWVVSAPFRLIGKVWNITMEAVGAAGHGVRVGFKPDLMRDRQDLLYFAEELEIANEAVKSAGANATQVQKDALATAAKDFNTTKLRLGFTEGEVGASVKGLWRSVRGVFGADVSKLGSTHVPKDVMAVADKAIDSHANIIQRVASKPFRVAANNPKTALFLGAAGATVGIANWLSGRAEERTQGEAMTQLAEAQMGAARNPYMNSVTPEETAILAERQRGGNGQRNDFCERMLAAKAATNPAQNAG